MQAKLTQAGKVMNVCEFCSVVINIGQAIEVNVCIKNLQQSENVILFWAVCR